MGAWQLLAFVPAAFAMSMTPGPSNLLAFANGTRSGLAAAARAALGRIGAYAILISLVAAGLGAVLEASGTAFRVVKWLGVAYLGWLAWSLWRAPVAELSAAQAAAEAPRLMRREFLTGIVNPKAVVLFTAVLPQFVVGETGYAAQLLALGAVYLVTEITAASLWAGSGAVLGARALRAGRGAWVNRGSGVVLGLAALWLAGSHRAA